jgi:hypothetical protein
VLRLPIALCVLSISMQVLTLAAPQPGAQIATDSPPSEPPAKPPVRPPIEPPDEPDPAKEPPKRDPPKNEAVQGQPQAAC